MIADAASGALSDVFQRWGPLAVTLLVGAAALFGTGRLVARRRRTTGQQAAVLHSLLMFALVVAVAVAVALALPIGDAARGQLLSLMGIVSSAAIALSSTTFLGNAMAGLMLRALRHIRPGDFVRVGDVFGRVSEQGLLHTELQTQERNLVTLPNLHLVSHAVEVVRSSGTVVATEVSLGYDVARQDVERLLLAAARDVELAEPFVHIMALGDFSIVYRVAGILGDVRLLLSRRSALNAAVLDALHEGGVEIVSPSFMNQRQLGPDQVMMPRAHRTGARRRGLVPEAASAPERVLFDKAEEAEAEEASRQELATLSGSLDELREAVTSADDAGRPAALAALNQAEARVAELEALLEPSPSD